MRFIEITDIDNYKHLVNLDSIKSVETTLKHCIIYLGDSIAIKTAIEFEKIKHMIQGKSGETIFTLS
jgi:hypothetical protein